MTHAHLPAAGLRITHAKGALRRAGAAYLARHHYMQSDGGSGCLFVIEGSAGEVQGACLVGATASANVERSLLGACLIGPAGSRDAERALVAHGVCVRQIKRSHVLDGVPMYESQLIRHAMRQVCDDRDEPVLYVSYADLGATDERTGLPMGGFVYLTAGFLYVGETVTQRWCVIDHAGRARSSRQGAITLSRSTLPKAGEIFHGEHVTKDWRMVKLPPARIWIAIQTPSRMSRLQAKRARAHVVRQLNPNMRVAAMQWVDFRTWAMRPPSIQALGRPRRLRGAQRFQPALWPPSLLARTAAPVWVPMQWQQRLVLDHDVLGERTAGRRYMGLCEA